MLCLHCSPPTSDPRAPEQEKPHSLLTDINWAPGASSDSPETEGSPARPRDPRTGTPAQLAQPPRRSRCARNDRAAHQAKNPMNTILTPASEQRTTRRETARAHDSQRRRPHHLKPQQRPYAILRYAGKSPVLSRDPRPDGHS